VSMNRVTSQQHNPPGLVVPPLEAVSCCHALDVITVSFKITTTKAASNSKEVEGVRSTSVLSSGWKATIAVRHWP